MGAIDNAEDDIFEALGLLVLVAVLLIAYLVYTGFKDFDLSSLLNKFVAWLFGGSDASLGTLFNDWTWEQRRGIDLAPKLKRGGDESDGKTDFDIVTGTSIGNMNPAPDDSSFSG
jgi:hypothetical protein